MSFGSFTWGIFASRTLHLAPPSESSQCRGISWTERHERGWCWWHNWQSWGTDRTRNQMHISRTEIEIKSSKILEYSHYFTLWPLVLLWLTIYLITLSFILCFSSSDDSLYDLDIPSAMADILPSSNVLQT